MYFQDDGNLVIADGRNTVIWAANSHGKGGRVLKFQDDRNCVIYTDNGIAVWTTHTQVKDGEEDELRR